MKIILLNILFISAMFAQSGLTVVGGLNQSKQTIEEDADDLDINYMNGYIFMLKGHLVLQDLVLGLIKEALS